MAIYHLEAKVVSRGTGRSAVAASAYLSCSKILNDYDGVQHDYTRKKGLVWQDVFLPEFAPPEWKDRGVLWNAVEENEKTKDSRLAREFVPALPVELTPAQWQELLTDFIQSSFVAEGMCADVAIHDPHPPGHNPHAHITIWTRMDSVSRMGKAAGKIIGRIRPTGTIKEMWRFGGQRGQPTPTGRWNLPVDRSALTTAVTSGRALIKFPLSIWGQLPAKWKSAVSAPTRGK